MRNLLFFSVLLIMLTSCVSSVDESDDVLLLDESDEVQVNETQEDLGAMEEPEDNFSLEYPPDMLLKFGDNIHTCSNGTVSWYNFEADADPDFWNGMYEDQMIELSLGERIDIEFEVMPDNIAITRRRTDMVSFSDFYVILEETEGEKDIIYEIKASWPEGYAYYVFRVIPES